MTAATARAAWSALWSGRLRVASVRDRAGVRAIALAPAHGDGLSPRQAQVARALACGFAGVDVAAALSIAPSTVGTYAAHAAAKLGLSLRALGLLLPSGLLPETPDLARALAGPLPCPCPRGATFDGRTLRFPIPAAAVPDGLTAAERLVLRGLLSGRTTAQIARSRKTSPRTVANQISAVYRKLGVAGRRELDPGLLAALSERSAA